MNTATVIEPKNESKAPFLTPKEQEDFKIWIEKKIHTGSKSYDVDGKPV